MTMKGMNLVVEIGVVLVIAFLVALASYTILMPTVNAAGSQEVSATLTICCQNFVIGGYCNKDSSGAYEDFENIGCSVDPKISSSGSMNITQLAGKAGQPATKEGVQKFCCK